jgi:ribulose-phosphate 3-epimerase
LTSVISIAPSLLAADFTRLGDQIAQAEAAGVEMIHIDVMDGQFVPNITMGPLIVEAARRSTNLPLDVHLMIQNPDAMLVQFKDAGATTIHVHWEACTHLHRTLAQIQALGCRVGIALNPHTPAILLTEIIHMVDTVLVMTVNPGFGGQAMIPETLNKVRQLRALAQALEQPFDIMVDGGIKAENATEFIEAGANQLVVGTGIYNKQFTVQEGVAKLRAVIAQATVK